MKKCIFYIMLLILLISLPAFAVPCAFDGTVQVNYGDGYVDVDPGSITAFVNDTTQVDVWHLSNFESAGNYVIHVDAGGKNVKFKISGYWTEQGEQYCNSSTAQTLALTTTIPQATSSGGSSSSGGDGTLTGGATPTGPTLVAGQEDTNKTATSEENKEDNTEVLTASTIASNQTNTTEAGEEKEEGALTTTGMAIDNVEGTFSAVIFVIVFLIVIYAFYKALTSSGKKKKRRGAKHG